MLFIRAEDFFDQASRIPRLTREEEKQLARQMGQDAAARQRLIQSYFPLVAGYIRRAPRQLHTLRTVYVCLASLEKGVDSFDFLQDSEPFSRHLCRRLRQCITRCLADR
jgi:DNA-directed RNA polymerase specialized sigma subunit